MDTGFRPVERKKFARAQSKTETQEDKIWKTFRHTNVIKHFAAINYTDFSPIAPHYYAVSTASKLIIYDPETHEPWKTFSRFRNIVYSGSFRSDGKMLVAGSEEGVVRLFGLDSKMELRALTGHSSAVRTTKFSYDNLHVLSGSEDKTARYWDISTATQLSCLTGHEDYVRCASSSPANVEMWATGGYDHMIKLWDTRSATNINTLNHGHPVEAVLMFPTGTLVASAGGNQVKIWDLLGGGKLLYTLSGLQKAATSLLLNTEANRLLVAGLDHHVKVYNVLNYTVASTLTFPEPILTCSLSPDNTKLVAGMSDGTLMIKCRPVKAQELVLEKEKREHDIASGPRRLSARRTQDFKEDYRIEIEKRVHLKKYDNYLMRLKYHDALDAALQSTDPVVTLSVIEELIRRDALTTAFSGRNEMTLEPLLKYLVSHINDIRYGSALIYACDCVLDIYSAVYGQSETIDALFTKLRDNVEKEIAFQKELFGILGSLSVLINRAH